MAQNFYTKWQNAILADAGGYVSKEYRSFQTALVREISKYATAVGAQVASNLKGHYDTSCFIERNGKFVYISHSSTLARMGGGVRVELDLFLKSFSTRQTATVLLRLLSPEIVLNSVLPVLLPTVPLP